MRKERERRQKERKKRMDEEVEKVWQSEKIKLKNGGNRKSLLWRTEAIRRIGNRGEKKTKVLK